MDAENKFVAFVVCRWLELESVSSSSLHSVRLSGSAMSQSFLQRLKMLLKRRRAAKKLRVPLSRGAWFKMPEEMWFEGRMVPLSAPDDDGVHSGFIQVLLNDDYDMAGVVRSGVKVETVLDVGANAGFFALAARQAFPDARIHHYEVNPSLEPFLAAQCKAARTDYFMEALGKEDGKVELSFLRSLVGTMAKASDSGTLPKTSFATAIERLGGHVDFAKIDCEGAEWELLEDTASWQKVSHVAMEYHLTNFPEHSADEAAMRLRELGFHVTSEEHHDGYGILRASRAT